MKKLMLITATIWLASSAVAQQDFGLPELHRIQTATLSPTYSCRPPDQQGYQNTALFLSDYSRQRNSPDLLFNGACGSEDYFEASTAGDDMALIADLGTDVPLESVTAHLAFNTQNVFRFSAYSKFASVAKVEVNHTYAVLLNKSEIRGLFVLTVVNHVPNQRVDLRYAVKLYQILRVEAESPGFDWERESF